MIEEWVGTQRANAFRDFGRDQEEPNALFQKEKVTCYHLAARNAIRLRKSDSSTDGLRVGG